MVEGGGLVSLNHEIRVFKMRAQSWHSIDRQWHESRRRRHDGAPAGGYCWRLLLEATTAGGGVDDVGSAESTPL